MIALSVFGLGFLSATAVWITRPQIDVQWREHNQFDYRPTKRIQLGPEIMLLYIGDSTCPESTKEDLPAILDQIQKQVREYAIHNGWAYVSYGISIDWNVEDGVRHLSKAGSFDQISTGRKWANESVMVYIWAKSYGPPATPQIVVVGRSIDHAFAETTGFGIKGEEFLLRRVGSVAIS